MFWLGLFLLFIVLPLISNQFFPSETFPENWNIGLRQPIDAFEDWVIDNRRHHPAFLYFFNPLSDAIDASVKALESFFIWLPWLVVVAISFALAYRASGWGLAIFCALGMVFMGLSGYGKRVCKP